MAGEEVSPQEALYADIFWEEIDSFGGFYGNVVLLKNCISAKAAVTCIQKKSTNIWMKTLKKYMNGGR